MLRFSTTFFHLSGCSDLFQSNKQRLMLRLLLVIIYKYWWSDNIFHLVADIAFKNKHKAQKTYLMQLFYWEKALWCLMGTNPCWMWGRGAEFWGKDVPQQPCVWRAAMHGRVSSHPSGPTQPHRVSSRDDRKTLLLTFREFPALHETPSLWRRSEHAGFKHGGVSKCLACCRLCNWGKMLPLLLPSPIYFAYRQFVAKRGIFFPIPSRGAVLWQSTQWGMLNVRTLSLVQGTWDINCWELESALEKYCLTLASALLKMSTVGPPQRQGTGLASPGQPTFCSFSSKIPPRWEGRGQILLW